MNKKNIIKKSIPAILIITLIIISIGLILHKKVEYFFGKYFHNLDTLEFSGYLLISLTIVIPTIYFIAKKYVPSYRCLLRLIKNMPAANKKIFLMNAIFIVIYMFILFKDPQHKTTAALVVVWGLFLAFLLTISIDEYVPKKFIDSPDLKDFLAYEINKNNIFYLVWMGLIIFILFVYFIIINNILTLYSSFSQIDKILCIFLSLSMFSFLIFLYINRSDSKKKLDYLKSVNRYIQKNGDSYKSDEKLDQILLDKIEFSHYSYDKNEIKIFSKTLSKLSKIFKIRIDK
ncbi:hypothetical protein [Francisella philomiragia]|uniref:hypothetical protein n=1 Tax=Francisella philomiragia TaxID=28110 RepID=UPI001C9E0DEF|nr:hypothetical protein [Francisella philomiragia]MBY7735051.1 hypothetical protein [Francisella philomiragia]